jgi:hypothetical protein
MKNTIALAMTAALALSACDLIGAGRPNKAERNESAEANGSSEANSSRSEDEASERSTGNGDSGGDRGTEDGGSEGEGEGSARSSAGAAGLEGAIREVARRAQERLPMRDGPGMITAMEADGTRLLVTLAVEQDLSEADWDQLAQGLQRNICGDRGSRTMIERGASVVYRVRDGEGERQNLRTSRCS